MIDEFQGEFLQAEPNEEELEDFPGGGDEDTDDEDDLDVSSDDEEEL